METLDIHPDIRQAQTLPSRFYTDDEAFAKTIKHIFGHSWQLIMRNDQVRLPKQHYPFHFMDKVLEEPLLFTRDQAGQLHCLSNVCTHRGNLLCMQPGVSSQIRCRYHGRRFKLDGCFDSMPEFEEVADFPSERDHLRKMPFGEWAGFLFSALDPAFDLETMLQPMIDRVGWMPFEEFIFDPGKSRDYLVKANWALYVDNYLEGFHIPFIHSDLARSLDYNSYRHELFDYSNLQVGIGKGGELTFDLPSDSPDAGQDIAAYYFWLYPNMMFNFYPWGLSVNIVRPLGPALTRVSFQSYVWKPELCDYGAGALLDKVEREDEEIVENVQQGMRSRVYDRGRYSPKREVAVHHFHRLLDQFYKD